MTLTMVHKTIKERLINMFICMLLTALLNRIAIYAFEKFYTTKNTTTGWLDGKWWTFSWRVLQHRAYNMIMQHHLLRCYHEKEVIELEYKFASVTNLTKNSHLQTYLNNFSLYRETLLLIHEKSWEKAMEQPWTPEALELLCIWSVIWLA